MELRSVESITRGSSPPASRRASFFWGSHVASPSSLGGEGECPDLECQVITPGGRIGKNLTSSPLRRCELQKSELTASVKALPKASLGSARSCHHCDGGWAGGLPAQVEEMHRLLLLAARTTAIIVITECVAGARRRAHRFVEALSPVMNQNDPG